MLGYLVRRLGTRSGPPQTQGVAGDDKWVNSGKSAGILGMRRILVLLGEPRQVGCLFSSTTCKGSVTRRESAERDAVEDTLFHSELDGSYFHIYMFYNIIYHLDIREFKCFTLQCSHLDSFGVPCVQYFKTIHIIYIFL